MVKKRILGCCLLAMIALGTSSFTNSASTQTATRFIAGTFTKTQNFTVNGNNGTLTLTYFTSGGLYDAPVVTIAGVGTYTLNLISHQPGSGSPTLDKWSITIPASGGDYVIDASIAGIPNSFWDIYSVTPNFIPW